MDLDLTRTFLAVLDNGTVGQAAERMGLSQPRSAADCNSWKRRWGRNCWNAGAAVHPTEMGRLVETEARAMVARWDRLQASIVDHLHLQAERSGGRRGHGGGVPSAASHWTIPPGTPRRAL